MPRDWDNFFVPEDFNAEFIKLTEEQGNAVAELASSLLRDELSRMPVVYSKHRSGWPDGAWCEMKSTIDCFKARLVCEEIMDGEGD